MPKPGDPITVLHVDDQLDFCELTKTSLERHDEFAIETATSASEGLERLETTTFDCIVSDYDMPGQNGIEFLKAVREEYPELPFILFTGKGGEEVASEAISMGVTDYLQKQVSGDQFTILANRIRNYVDRAQVQRERSRHLEAIETAGEGISILDADGRFVYVNEAYADLFGYDPAELRGEPWENIYRESEVRTIRDEAIPTVEETGHWHGETVGLRADGTTFLTEHSLVRTESGEFICTIRDITERKRSHRRLETLVENLPGLVYRCRNEPGWPMDEVRGDVEALTGYSAEDIETDDGLWGELIHEDDREEVWNAVQEAVETGEPFEVTYRIQRRDDEIKWVWERGQRIVSADSTDSWLEGFITDITPRMEMTEQLQKQRVVVDQALDALDDIFYVVSPNGELRRWNRRLVEVTGYGESTIEEMSIFELFPEEQHDRIAAGIEHVLEVGEGSLTADIRRADGERIPYEFSGSQLSVGDGDVLGVVGIGRQRDSGV